MFYNEAKLIRQDIQCAVTNGLDMEKVAKYDEEGEDLMGELFELESVLQAIIYDIQELHRDVECEAQAIQEAN